MHLYSNVSGTFYGRLQVDSTSTLLRSQSNEKKHDLFLNDCLTIDTKDCLFVLQIKTEDNVFNIKGFTYVYGHLKISISKDKLVRLYGSNVYIPIQGRLDSLYAYSNNVFILHV